MASFTQADYMNPCSSANKEHGSVTKETRQTPEANASLHKSRTIQEDWVQEHRSH